MFWKNARKIRKKEKFACDMKVVKKELKRFVYDYPTPFIIHCDLDKKRILRLLTNRPGPLIGKQGSNLEKLKQSLKEQGVIVKKILIYEAKHMVSNDIVIENPLSLIDEVIK